MEDDWIDATHIGSQYETQVNTRTGRLRWRPFGPPTTSNRIKLSPRTENSYVVEEEWTYEKASSENN